MVDKMDDHGISTELSRDLNLFHLTMMGIGMMIGAGVFLGVGNAVRIAGPGGVLLTFALNGLVAMFTAMSYAELSSAVPRAGGAYNFARIAFGKGASFISGWMEWFASSVAGSLYAVTFSIYSLHFFDQLGLLDWLPLELHYAEKILAVIIGLLFLYVNYRGASETGKTGAFFTLGQMITLGIIGVVGLWVVIKDPSRLQNFQPFLPLGGSKLLITMGFTYVAFEGYEVIAQAGDEAIDPRKNLPKAMIYSIFIVTVTYLLVSFAAIIGVKSGSAGIDGPVWEWIAGFREKGFGMAIQRLMPFGGFLVTLTVIFASTSALNATIYSATRASYALGRDRLLPGMFAKISTKTKTPYIALAGTGLIVLSVAGFLPTMDVASSASMMFLLLFFLVNICVIKIRRNMGDELTYGYIMPFFPIPPLLALVMQSLLVIWMHHMSMTAWIIAPAWIISGVLIYHSYSKSRAVFQAHDIVVIEEEKAEERAGYKVLIPVANPDNAIMLVRNAFRLLKIKQAEVDILNMVRVPEQIPLSNAEDYLWEGREAITEAMIYVTTFFPITTTIRYCRNVARGIISAAREKRVDTILMGWKGKSSRTEYLFGSTIDPVIQRAPCNVLVFKNCQETTYARILVPVSDSPSSLLALEIASILVDPDKGVIVPFNITAPGDETLDLDEFIGRGTGEFLDGKNIKPQYAVAKNVSEVIIQQAADYDLIVMGASNDRSLNNIIKGTIPERVSQGCDKPMVMAKATKGFKSLVRRYI